MPFFFPNGTTIVNLHEVEALNSWLKKMNIVN